MTKRILYVLLFCFTALLQLRAQPSPCGNPAAMTPTCNPACVICDIDGFTGINNSTTVGQAPPGFCTMQVHHMQWIAFLAGSTNLTLEVEVFNCQDGAGLEIGIYSSSNCQTFQSVSNCNTDVEENTTAMFTNTVPLVIGQYYYFVMDGSDGDICNYTINVLSGTTEVPMLFSSGTIQGDFSPCANVSQTYATTNEPGATAFEWLIDGVTAGNGQSFSHNWTTPGTHELCVQATNACDEAPPSCQTITVLAVPPTEISTTLCAGECLAVADTSLCDAGNYVFHLPSAAGCDSVVQVSLQYNQPAVTNLGLNICDGDTIYVAGQPFFQSGQYQEILATLQGCDSTINLDLTVVICQIAGNVAVENVACSGASTGKMSFSVANGTPPFNYNWERVGTGTPVGQGDLTALNETETIDNLPVGTYLVTIADNFGNQLILIAEVTSPPALTLGSTMSSYNGFGVSCSSSADGALEVSPGGGVPPYGFAWSNGSAQGALTGLSAGTYVVTLTDGAGCTLEETFELTAPDSLQVSCAFVNPGCDGPETGSARVETVSGGTPPFSFDLSGSGFALADTFTALGTGNYILSARDANGCIASQTGTLIAAVIPAFDLGEDLTIDLGQEVSLQVVSNVPLDSTLWSPVQGLSCFTCLEPDAIPTETITYVLTASAVGNCFRSDSVTIRVNKVRNVYIPNVFSPNGDGENDRLVVFGGDAVEKIPLLRVYSRWGELLYEGFDLIPNNLATGWDGRFHGKPVNPGVFTWLAEVEFLDGVVQEYSGSVTVLP